MQCCITTEPHRGATYDDLLAVATATEQLGFDGFFRSDHFLRSANLGGDESGVPGPTDAWLTLAAMARETSRLRLGTLVTSATFRLPGILAISVAQVDQMSRGRIELGLGTGWFQEEHTSYGIPLPSTAVRFERLEEQLQILTGLWTTPVGETFSFTGKHYALHDSPALPKPVQVPHPPIIIGGAGATKTPRLAARWADEFNLMGSVEGCGTQFARVRVACKEIGRDLATLRFSVGQTIFCGRDEKEVERRVIAGRGARQEVVHRQGRPSGGNAQLSGTPREVVGRLREFHALGVDRIYLQILDYSDLEHLELLAADVLPHLRQLTSVTHDLKGHAPERESVPDVVA